MKPWKRYRFKTNSVNDPRPLLFDAAYPWWCSGEGEGYAIIIAYLPSTEELTKYWDDAFDIDWTEEEEIVFTDRFSKPKWYKS